LLVVSWLTDLILILRSTKDVWGVHIYYQYIWRHVPYYGPENLKIYTLFIAGFLSCFAPTDGDSLSTPTGFDIRADLVGFVLDTVTKYYPNMNISLQPVFIIPPKLYFYNRPNSKGVVL